MPANRFGINLAEALGDAERIKGSRIKNKMAQMKLDETVRLEDERPAREAAAAERANMLGGLRQEAVGGSDDAARELLAMDPEGASKFIEAIGGMDDAQREAVKRSIDEIGQVSHYVLTGNTPQEQSRRYQLARQNMAPETAAKLPEQYDPQFVQMSLSKATAMDKMLEAPTVRGVGGDDVVYRGGLEVERKAKPLKSAGGSGSGSGGLKSADESLMYRQSAELMGGMFDDAGNLRALDPAIRPKVQQIATEATKIYQQGGVTRSEAVTMAKKKIDDAETDPKDPNSIRQYLLK